MNLQNDIKNTQVKKKTLGEYNKRVRKILKSKLSDIRQYHHGHQ